MADRSELAVGQEVRVFVGRRYAPKDGFVGKVAGISDRLVEIDYPQSAMHGAVFEIKSQAGTARSFYPMFKTLPQIELEAEQAELEARRTRALEILERHQLEEFGHPGPPLAVLEAAAAAVERADEKPLMVKYLVPDGTLIPGELLLDRGVELPPDAPADALYRVKWASRG